MFTPEISDDRATPSVNSNKDIPAGVYVEHQETWISTEASEVDATERIKLIVRIYTLEGETVPRVIDAIYFHIPFTAEFMEEGDAPPAENYVTFQDYVRIASNIWRNGDGEAFEYDYMMACLQEGMETFSVLGKGDIVEVGAAL